MDDFKGCVRRTLSVSARRAARAWVKPRNWIVSSGLRGKINFGEPGAGGGVVSSMGELTRESWRFEMGVLPGLA